MQPFYYIYNAVTHSDTSDAYMQALGMNDEQIESVLQQKKFETSQNIERRKEAYKTESDPLFMEWQYDQTPEAKQAWHDKVREIKDRWPI